MSPASDGPEAPRTESPQSETESGLGFDPVYGPDALDGWDPETQLGSPGEFPFTRGVYPSMYTGRPWTMRQYAGFGTAASPTSATTSCRAGTGGLSVAFDLPHPDGATTPTRPQSHGEVGKVGVAIDSIEDMRLLFDGIPLARCPRR
jgi:methylmalonyl-CoA mutase N-terminal domain/subunit